MLHPGLYEQVINTALGKELDGAADKLCQTAPIDDAEASRVLAKYVTEIIEKGLDNVKDNGGDLHTQVSLANKIVALIRSETRRIEFRRHERGQARGAAFGAAGKEKQRASAQ